MINLKHADGDAARPEDIERWFQNKLERIKAYWALNDQERAVVEAQELSEVLDKNKLPSNF